ncbi:MAG: carbamoyltransferase N-terminal domain-containing protein, partial [Candidatus Binatia bacterium]
SMTIILGINAYHGDSSAALIRNGQIVAAAEEERFRRIKHWAGFPSEAIRYCLREAGVTLPQVEYVAVNRDPRENLWRKIRYTVVTRPDLRLLFDRAKNAREWASIADALGQAFPGEQFQGQVHHVEHHLAHLASAFLVSSFDEAVALSVDGFGDFASACWGIGRGSEIEVQGKVHFPHSLGMFYQAMTQYLGFPHYGDEYKVMGLAPYGEPHFIKEMSRMVVLQADGSFQLNLDFFRHHKENLNYTWKNCAPAVDRLFSSALDELLGPARGKDEPLTQRHRDIAHSVQLMYEQAFFHLLNALYDRCRLPTLALAGGCAMNSVANGKVYRNTPFTRMYVQSAAGDAGGAI